MAQNIYDNEVFFDGYAQLSRSREGLDGAPEWPALERLLPDLSDKKVVDLGCGYGWFCRAAAEKGAKYVLGLDLSEKMLEKAKAMTPENMAGLIEYRQADLDSFSLPGAFDFAYSSLTLHYIVDIARFFRTVYNALSAGAYFVFSVEHPIFTSPENQGWHVDGQGRKSWPVNNYQMEGTRVSNWIVDGVIKQHRTLGTLVNELLRAGFQIRHFEEWGPSDEQVAAMPALEEERDRPMLALLKVQRQ